MSQKTEIKGNQIKLTDFIKNLASNATWDSTTLTASQAAIASKIQSALAELSGAMLYKGEWSALTDPSTIKAGFTYVFPGTTSGSIAASNGDPAVVLEPGDVLIAKINNANPTRSSHWTIVNFNLTGALTRDDIISVNTNSCTVSWNSLTGKLEITSLFPTVSNSSDNTSSWTIVTGISIDATTGVITVNRRDPTEDIIISERKPIVSTRPVTYTTSRRLKSVNHISMYVNGVKQSLWTSSSSPGANDIVDAVVAIDNTGAGSITFQDGAYIPTSGDIVLIDYVSAGSLVSAQ